jgi:hypothetical protein|tara:strand:+ start:628 stop:780 length:153 start_codon:yes stop_codon:yes gene_type:complete
LKKNKETKQREAKKRQEYWDGLSPEDQLAHLDKNKYRAKKQRRKIAHKMR